VAYSRSQISEATLNGGFQISDLRFQRLPSEI